MGAYIESGGGRDDAAEEGETETKPKELRPSVFEDWTADMKK